MSIDYQTPRFWDRRPSWLAALSLDIIEEGEGDDYTKLIEIRLGPNIDNKKIFQAGGHKGRFLVCSISC